MRSSVKLWVGFVGKSVVLDVANAAGLTVGETVCPWDWETPLKGVTWMCIYGEDGNTLVGLGLPLLEVLGARFGDPTIESISLSELEKKAATLKLLLIEFLERRKVPNSLISKVDTWICPACE